jgi:Lrp/AsnC family leucine-responsive transcriptional regulator
MLSNFACFWYIISPYSNSEIKFLYIAIFLPNHYSKHTMSQPELDEVDRRILNALQTDASQTNAELAELVHVSAPTCLRRVKLLTERGIIERQVAIVSPDKVGARLTAVVEITLDVQAAEKMSAFEQHVAAEAAVLQCYRVAPGPDFVLIVQVADMPAYHALAHRLFATHTNVRNVKAYFSTFRSKFDTRIAV